MVVGGLSLMAAKQQHELLWVWIILLAVFVSDATVTLIRRLLRKQKPHVAHRSHAYQHLAIRFNSHAKVSLLVLVINVVWLLPIAFFVANKQLAGTTGVVIAYVPLLVAALALNADRVLQMSAEQRQQVLANLQQWQALTPKQRQRALLQRERLRELPPQMRKHIKERFDELKRQPGGVEAACPGPPEARLACLAEEPLPVSPANRRPRR
jgi:hypothetical protein